MRRILLFLGVVLLLLVVLGVAGAIMLPRAIERRPLDAARLPASMQLWPSIYLAVALGHVRDGLPRQSVDWDAVSSHAHDMAKSAKTPADTYPAIRYALEQLGPDRGELRPPGTAVSAGAYGMQVLFPERVVATVYPASPADIAGIHAGDLVEAVNGAPPVVSPDARFRGQFVDIPRPRATLRVRRPGAADTQDISIQIGSYQLLPGHTAHVGPDLGYVEVPGASNDPEFPVRLRMAIAQTDGPALCGWIVDLRRNSVGAIEPAIAAVRSILGEGPIGGFKSSAKTTSWTYPPVREGEPPLAPLAHPGAPVAVLTSRLTAGNVVVAFRGRQDTRSFGEPTWTASPRINGMLADHAELDVAYGVVVDRTGREYWDRVDPDQAVAIDWTKFGAPDDPVIAAAGTWLRSLHECTKK